MPYSYGKKSMDTFLNKIKYILIGYGNWGRSTQMEHFLHTMNKGLRTQIHKKYDLTNVQNDVNVIMIHHITSIVMETSSFVCWYVLDA